MEGCGSPQPTELNGKCRCTNLGNNVAARRGHTALSRSAEGACTTPSAPGFQVGGSLYGRAGRKYLNRTEVKALLAAAGQLAERERLLIELLVWTGCRTSEALALTAASFQINAGIVAIRTLKRRRFAMREIPIPPDFVAALDRHFDLRTRQRDPAFASECLWPICRQTAWRLVKRVATEAGVVGPSASPRGLRHAFGVSALQTVPVMVLQRWLGHASLRTTAIYADASGAEEAAIARRYWETSAYARSNR